MTQFRSDLDAVQLTARIKMQVADLILSAPYHGVEMRKHLREILDDETVRQHEGQWQAATRERAIATGLYSAQVSDVWRDDDADEPDRDILAL